MRPALHRFPKIGKRSPIISNDPLTSSRRIFTSHENGGYLSTIRGICTAMLLARSTLAMQNPTTSTQEDLTMRARAEFREMPGMCLTTAQAARLWQLSPARAEELLSDLVQAGFLVRREGQRYRLPSSV
jgi:Fic family protein